MYLIYNKEILITPEYRVTKYIKERILWFMSKIKQKSTTNL